MDEAIQRQFEELGSEFARQNQIFQDNMQERYEQSIRAMEACGSQTISSNLTDMKLEERNRSKPILKLSPGMI